jgi:hypothetical protein
MKAEKLLQKRLVLAEASFVDIKIWRVPEPVRGSLHDIKYSLALVAEGICRLRYYNEASKGDHKHIGLDEVQYTFSSLDELQADFWKDVEEWMQQNMQR